MILKFESVAEIVKCGYSFKGIAQGIVHYGGSYMYINPKVQQLNRFERSETSLLIFYYAVQGRSNVPISLPKNS